MLMQKLKAATRADHDRMELVSHSEQIAAGTLTRALYFELVLKQHYIHQKLEPLVAEALPKQWKTALAFEQRIKLPLLEKDMAINGLGPQMLQVPDIALPDLPAVAQAAGCLYVMEGATLGGMVIVKKLRQNPHLEGIPAFHYYSCYGDQTGPFWKNFASTMDAHITDEQEQGQAIAAAQATFRFFEEVMAQAVVKIA